MIYIDNVKLLQKWGFPKRNLHNESRKKIPFFIKIYQCFSMARSKNFCDPISVNEFTLTFMSFNIIILAFIVNYLTL